MTDGAVPAGDDGDATGTGDAGSTSDSSSGDSAEAVSCRALDYSFGDTKAVDGLDLSVRTGEIFGLLGPNGAGKTTAIRCITTLLPVPPDIVKVFGHDAAKEKMAVRRLLGYVPQQLSADAAMTGRENVTLFARVFDVPRRERAARVAQALDVVDLSDAADRMAQTYSGGMIRRLELAQALVSAPRLLMLDEPTIGLDPIARSSVWEHINAVRRATGMTVLVTTHYMDEAEQYCDRVGLMHRGRIHALGTPGELREELRERRRAEADEARKSGTTGESAETAESGEARSDTVPTLEDVFRDVVGQGLEEEGGTYRDVRSTRRTASRLG
ncbi:ABC transporter ATP-binding protein [Streptomyces camponoticapitis]|uniref:ABC transporter ATP-binding protein n=1 Tax=Streptomyces camponoticapitis TaxID=1616125 RepID=A0ABQ2ER08_9ACTN|nr:ATP-binding cassette domain-containing protein [Streptomyces camponoticapitis]GGK18173.1 ABC transporter ATP-binding protein [Streptomyces camponoticapitis]